MGLSPQKLGREKLMSRKVQRRDFLKRISGGLGLLATFEGGAWAAEKSEGSAGGLKCDLTRYKEVDGLQAAVVGDALVVVWDGDKDQKLRLRMGIDNGTPTIRDLSIQQGAEWNALVTGAIPDFRFVSGYRRMDRQQMEPLDGLKIPITAEIIEKEKWNAFWDAPLMLPGTEPGGSGKPPVEGIGGQPGLPRRPEEVHRGIAVYQATSCAVVTNGARLEITFPGVQMGDVFSGRLQYTVYKGSNLVRQEVIAKTEMPSVAYKYDAGIKGVAIQPASRMVWRDINNQWLDNQLGGPANVAPTIIYSANRVAAAEVSGGAIAAFPPPHNFFWQSELDINFGNSWCRKDSDTSFAFGVRQAEFQASQADAGRGPSETRENWALRNARPGTWQRMPVYFYVSANNGQSAIEGALAFTRNDKYKPLPGCQVKASHFHTGMVRRLLDLGGLDITLPDFEVAKAAGVNIWGPIDGGANGPATKGANREERNASLIAGAHADNLAVYYEAARLHSDKNFVVMPNEEIAFGTFAGLDIALGGHTDLIMSHPVYWNPGRAPGQPLVEGHPKYGKVYHCGTPEDLMEMARLENLLLYMPHPRAKGSTGFPDAIKDKPHFQNENWHGIGFRWGLGLDGSEVRLSDYRCQQVFDDMNNWVADLPTPPKMIQAISEFEALGFTDDFYANNPVDYLRLDALPEPGDWRSIVDVMKKGDYFTTSGEVLIPHYAMESEGSKRTITADVEWTFPLEFAEVVWGDGKKTERQIIPATELPAFGNHRFEIPFNAAGKKWVRFAVWDCAGNGAMVQPIKLNKPAGARPD
jgi:hypothetical protein